MTQTGARDRIWRNQRAASVAVSHTFQECECHLDFCAHIRGEVAGPGAVGMITLRQEPYPHSYRVSLLQVYGERTDPLYEDDQAVEDKRTGVSQADEGGRCS